MEFFAGVRYTVAAPRSFNGAGTAWRMLSYPKKLPDPLYKVELPEHLKFGALRYSRFAAWHSYIAVTGYLLDLTMHSLPPRKPVHNNASLRQVLCGIHARIIPRGLASESSYDS